MAEQTLTCTDCGATFPFTEEEQAFYEEKGFSAPKRCRDCRSKKKDARRTVTEVTCAGCGQKTTVPFIPREGGRPVYCRDCFEKQRGGMAA